MSSTDWESRRWNQINLKKGKQEISHKSKRRKEIRKMVSPPPIMKIHTVNPNWTLKQEWRSQHQLMKTNPRSLIKQKKASKQASNGPSNEELNSSFDRSSRSSSILNPIAAAPPHFSPTPPVFYFYLFSKKKNRKINIIKNYGNQLKNKN